MIALVIVLLAGVVVLLLSRFSGSAKSAQANHGECCGCGHHHDHAHPADCVFRRISDSDPILTGQ
jgi:hypothetical protein